MKSTICVAEDRVVCEPPLKILLLSLSKHCPGVEVNLFYPGASDDFRRWMKKCPRVVLQATGLKSGFGWNVKPQAIMRLLDRGFDEVIWIDSDILVNRNIKSIVSGLTRETLVLSEHTLGARERDDQDALRARAWGLPVGRVLPSALSSGVVRATKVHYRLMQRWWELLHAPEYQNCQRNVLEWEERPFHLRGDQDVLTALLTSREFSDLPIFELRRGKFIIQFDGVWGYTVAERIRNLLGDGPAFVHSGAGKPWSEAWQLDPPTLREYIKKSYLDMSPYVLLAKRFRKELECDTEWMDPHYKLSRVLRALGMGHSALAGLPMAIVFDFARFARWALRDLA